MKFHLEGKDASPEEEMAEPILAGQDEYQQYYQESVFRAMQGKPGKRGQAGRYNK